MPQNIGSDNEKFDAYMFWRLHGHSTDRRGPSDGEHPAPRAYELCELGRTKPRKKLAGLQLPRANGHENSHMLSLAGRIWLFVGEAREDLPAKCG